MLRLLLGAVLLFALAGCASVRPPPWEKAAKVTAITAATAITLDGASTIYAVHERGFYERNPLLGPTPSKGKIVAWVALEQATALWLPTLIFGRDDHRALTVWRVAIAAINLAGFTRNVIVLAENP